MNSTWVIEVLRLSLQKRYRMLCLCSVCFSLTGFTRVSIVPECRDRQRPVLLCVSGVTGFTRVSIVPERRDRQRAVLLCVSGVMGFTLMSMFFNVLIASHVVSVCLRSDGFHLGRHVP